ncbi:J domain-containing protein isoform X2 [Ceratitis capitata]|uniref:J domain-containing protein n=1 Tax=Ceratitis capitata TaxID=7213 RepID=W8BBJ0_CERCA|nr:J domain-containing protein isoform X2 [Ceratitis capitata]
MSAVDAVLSFKRSPDEDFYGMLNCDENSSIEQIQAEYKILALQFHPDKNDGDKDAEAKFQKLKEAKETLCDPEKRANYDKWRNSGIAMSYKNWLGMKEHVGQSMHWATPKTKDRMLPESGATTGAGSSGGLSAASPNPAHRRASEGGAALYYGNRKTEWGTENSDVANKFRNYEI